jgi:PleD family two-component response regulator
MKQSPILVACEAPSNADLVRKLLSSEFAQIVVSANEDHVQRDFEQHCPRVLVLAFDTLEKAERYCLRLYRQSALAQTFTHRTVVLCSKAELQRAYDLCRNGCFDDYVLFWPLNFDAPRLAMAVRHALRETLSDGLEDKARQVAQLEDVLARRLEDGRERINAVNESVSKAGVQISFALDELSAKLVRALPSDALDEDGYEDVVATVTKIKTNDVKASMESIASALDPVRVWNGELRRDLEPAMASARAIKAMSQSIRPIVMVVDHDTMGRATVMQMLDEEPFDVIAVSTGAEMLATLRRLRPNVVLMDIDLPDIDGLEATRKLKSVALYSGTAVILMACRSNRQVVMDSIKAGAVDFVVKPVKRAMLVEKVRQYTSRSRAHRAAS